MTFAPLMTMPEASVHEDARMAFVQYDVWVSRQPRVIHPVPAPLLHKNFRTTISGFVSLLLTAAIFLCRCSIDKYYILNGILFFLNKCPGHIFIWSFVKL